MRRLTMLLAMAIDSGLARYTGFGGMPAGNFGQGIYEKFSESACFWSATETVGIIAIYRSLNYQSARFDSLTKYKDYGFSVRCVRDE